MSEKDPNEGIDFHIEHVKKNKKNRKGSSKKGKTVSRSQIVSEPKETEETEESTLKTAQSQKEPELEPLNENSEEEEENQKIPKKRGKRRTLFTKGEDNYIIDQYKGQFTNWNKIAEDLGTGRTGKLVRERYHNFLDKNYDHSPWDKTDLAYLCGLVKKVGTNWKIINHFFPRRTSTNIKNAFTCAAKKYKLDRSFYVSKGERSRLKAQFDGDVTEEMLLEIKTAVDEKISLHPDLDLQRILQN